MSAQSLPLDVLVIFILSIFVSSHYISLILVGLITLLNLPPTSRPFPPFSVVAELQCELPASCSKFPLATCFTYGSVCVSMLLSPSILPSPSSPLHVHKSVVYECVSIQFSSVVQSCPTLCDPMNHSPPGLPVSIAAL